LLNILISEPFKTCSAIFLFLGWRGVLEEIFPAVKAGDLIGKK